MRARRPRRLPVGDLVLRRALGGLSPRAVEAASQRWRPWRAYAVTRLGLPPGRLSLTLRETGLA